MDPNLVSLIVGIASSLLATAIFVLAAEFWRKSIRPWFEDKIYKGVRLDGEWTSTKIAGMDSDSSIGTMKFEIKQTAEKISGTYYHLDAKGEKTSYQITGVITNMYLTATAIPASSRVIDALAFLLYVKYEKSKLKLNGGILCTSKPGEVSSYIEMEFSQH